MRSLCRWKVSMSFKGSLELRLRRKNLKEKMKMRTILKRMKNEGDQALAIKPFEGQVKYSTPT